MPDWVKVFLGICLLGVVAFVLWLIGSAIQFLSDNRFVYGGLVGTVVGIVGTLVVQWVRRWWLNRHGQ